MRLAHYFLALVCFMLTLTLAKPSPLQERLPSIKSTTNQNYALMKPLSATLSYIYYATQSLSLSPYNDQTTIDTHIKFDANSNDSIIIVIKEQKDMNDDDKTKSIIMNNASSNTIDVNHHNGPVTALALVLFFCVLTF